MKMVLRAICVNITALMPIPGKRDMVHALKGVAIRPRIQIEENNGISFAVSCRHRKEPLCVKSCIEPRPVEDGGDYRKPGQCVGCYTVFCPALAGCGFRAVGKR